MTEEQEEPKQELEVWQPQRPFDGADLVPTIRPTGTISQLPVGGLIGRENVEPEDMVIPSLALLQGQSDPVCDGIPGAQPGKFFLHTTGEVLEAPLRLLLVHHSKSRALFPKPDNPLSKDLKKCLSRDYMTGTIYGDCDSCPYKEWTGDDSDVKPLCSESHNFIVWTDSGPAVLRFANSSYKAAKNFLTTWTTSNKNLWGHPVLVSVKRKTKSLPGGKDSTYFVMDLRWDQKEDVPPAFQASAVDTYTRIQEAHAQGRLKGKDEEVGFQE